MLHSDASLISSISTNATSDIGSGSLVALGAAVTLLELPDAYRNKHHTSYCAPALAVMGCGMSSEDKEGKQRNEEIENQLKKDKLMQRNEIKMLLLGMLPTPSTAIPYSLLMLLPLQVLENPASRRF